MEEDDDDDDDDDYRLSYVSLRAYVTLLKKN
jgi:hypothetical protein